MNCNTLIIDAFWVSNKPFPTALSPNDIDGRAFYDYYDGPARHLGWMDLVLLKNMIKKHKINHIILQNLNTLGRILQVTQELKVCIAHEYNKFIVHLPLQEKDLEHCKPIYTSMELGGWDFSEDDDQIPSPAQQYMRYLLVHTRVNSITCMTSKIKLTAHFNILGNVVFETEQYL